ncbi:MAG TPA: hypothetical protein DCS82_13100 [Rhodospirillaceae bacterium]|nr:hypothetical protein [Rhodospirillaceae bacterium]HAT36644.1 hypothetical protein [Rhodospirillaceae bacterium]
MEISVSQRRATIVVTLVTTAFFGMMLWRTVSFPQSMLPGYPGDAFFPQLIIGFGLIWCAILLYRLMSGKDLITTDDVAVVVIPVRDFILVCVYVVAYVMLLTPLGFEITTFLFMSVLFLTRFRGELKARLVRIVIVSLITTLVSWACFAIILNVNFPVKILPDYIQF